ncbi:MAG TPA: SIMPL domain-containing protein [Thermoanaerobaculia bacterium]|nr:SIMPL domain-containing protein [Thermoanaerobaculia bacterium]
MKRFLPILALICAPAALAQETASQVPYVPSMAQTVSVTGTGRSTVTPDRVTFSAGVQTVAETVDQAVNENNRKTAAVIAALKKGGATDAQIRTSNFSIYPQQDYQQGRLPQILGYQVSNNITVRRDNVADAGRLLQAAVNAGVNTSSGLRFEVSDPAAGRDQGLRAAYNDARSKAQLLAQAAGRTLGRAMMIAEGAQPTGIYPPRPMAMRAEAAQVVSDVPVEAGTQETTYTVSVVFQLQ